VTIDNLRCFIILAQELNFTRAAEKAHITQTAMSRKITSIENELSVQLLTRNHHQVGLTSAGQEFYNSASQLVEDYDMAVTQVQNTDRGLRTSIQIGVGVYEHTLLVPVMDRFTACNPTQKINCVQYKYRELLEKFDRDHLDIIVTSDQFFYTISKNGLDMVLLHDHAWVLALHRDNPIAASDPVELNSLYNQNIITMNEGSVNVVRSTFHQWFHLSSLEYVNTHETKLMMVNANRGVGFIPLFVNVNNYPNIVTRKLNPPYRPRKYYAIIKKYNSNPYAHQLVSMLEDYYTPKLWIRELETQSSS